MTAGPQENDIEPATMKALRRDAKRRPRMRVHGQGMKKLAARLSDGKKKSRSAR